MEDAFDGQDAVEGVVLERHLTCVGFDPGNVVAVGGLGLGLGGSELARVDVQVALLTIAVMTLASIPSFARLPGNAGEELSGHRV